MEITAQLHALATLPLGKEPQVSNVQEIGWPQSQSGRYGVEKNPLLGIKLQTTSPFEKNVSVSALMGLRKEMKDLNQDSPSCSRDMNHVPSKCEP
jgi:hypothetical protein